MFFKKYSTSDFHHHIFEINHEITLWTKQNIITSNVRAITFDVIICKGTIFGSLDWCNSCIKISGIIGEDKKLQNCVKMQVNKANWCCFVWKIYQWIKVNASKLHISYESLEGTCCTELDWILNGYEETCDECYNTIDL